MGEQRRKFSEEFKREAVRPAYESGRRLVDVSRELELRPDMIRRWRWKLGAGQGPVGSSSEPEVRRLQRELSLVREERDILRKALAIFSDRHSTAAARVASILDLLWFAGFIGSPVGSGRGGFERRLR